MYHARPEFAEKISALSEAVWPLGTWKSANQHSLHRVLSVAVEYHWSIPSMMRHYEHRVANLFTRTDRHGMIDHITYPRRRFHFSRERLSSASWASSPLPQFGGSLTVRLPSSCPRPVLLPDAFGADGQIAGPQGI
jgi:hypothetical protein